MKKQMMLAYLKENNLKVYDGEVIDDPEVRRDVIQVLEHSPCNHYHDLHTIYLIDVMAWAWAGGGAA